MKFLTDWWSWNSDFQIRGAGGPMAMGPLFQKAQGFAISQWIIMKFDSMILVGISMDPYP